MTNRMMIDFETLSTKTSAVTLSCGVVVFSDQIISEKLWNLDQYEQLSIGRHIDADTLAWWKRQSIEAWETSFSMVNAVGMRQFILEVGQMYKSNNCKELWCQGADFDIPILESMIFDVNEKPFYRYSDKRCSRTVRKLYKGVEPVLVGVAHNPLDDAKHQVNCVIQILKEWGCV
jgi:hypothetical protein